MQVARPTFAAVPMIEPLESRQLLSASVSASFIGTTPAVVLPNHAVQTTIRVTSTASAGVTRVELFASPVRGTTGGATLLAESKPIAAGRKTVQLRVSSSTVAPGAMYMVAQVVSAGDGSGSALVVCSAPRPTRFVAPMVDLAALFVRAPVGQVYVGGSEDTQSDAVIRVSNTGNVPAVGMVTATIYASSSTSFDASAVAVGSVSLGQVRIAPSAARFVDIPITFKARTAFGGYTLFAKVDGSLSITEVRTTNNVVRSPVAIVISQSRPAYIRRHHHHGGGGVDIGVIGDDDPGDTSDGSTDDSGDGNSTGDTNVVPPTTLPDAPTTQPGDDSGSTDAGSSSDSGDDSSGDSGGDGGDITDSLQPLILS